MNFDSVSENSSVYSIDTSMVGTHSYTVYADLSSYKSTTEVSLTFTLTITIDQCLVDGGLIDITSADFYSYMLSDPSESRTITATYTNSLGVLCVSPSLKFYIKDNSGSVLDGTSSPIDQADSTSGVSSVYSTDTSHVGTISYTIYAYLDGF
jgi:hypothetical protein